MEKDYEIYKGKNFSDLCKDIIKNSEEKKDQVDILMTDLRSMVKTLNDATMVIPMLKEYLDVAVRNDEQLIKLAAIIQRLMNGNVSSDNDSGSIMTEEEKKQLMQAFEEASKSTENSSKKEEIK
jgi:hypothetical protein